MTLTETVPGPMMVLGALTPAASAATTGLMTVAIGTVHGPEGLWVAEGGFEYNLSIVTAAVEAVAAGPGVLAVDGSLAERRTGEGWALAQLAIGVGAAAALMAIAGRAGEADAPAVDASPATEA
jgi:putative oxidoreductase